jgi:Choline dehydrogenase and related flavoproteins
MSMSPSQLGAFAKSDPEIRSLTRPDSSITCSRSRSIASGTVASLQCVHGVGVPVAADLARQHSHRIADASAPPLIAPNYLSTDYDRHVAANALRLTRRIAAAPALAPYRPQRDSARGFSTRPKKNFSRPQARSAPPSFIRWAPAEWVPSTIPAR